MANWDERYASRKFSTAKPHRLLVELAEKNASGKALDLACGIGRNAIFLAEKGWQVTAVDSSAVGLEIARTRAREKGVEIDFRLADLETSEFVIDANVYDLIADFYYLQSDLFEKIKAGLKPNGLFAAAIHIYGAGEESGAFLLEEGELRRVFDDFKILHYHETPPTDADTGEHHRRTAEIIARKI